MRYIVQMRDGDGDWWWDALIATWDGDRARAYAFQHRRHAEYVVEQFATLRGSQFRIEEVR
jgi:hypothetical protein